MVNMKLGVGIVLSVLLVAGFCYDNTTIGDLPPGVAAQLLSLLTNKTIEVIGGCGDPQHDDVELTLFTRDSNGTTIFSNTFNLLEIDATKPVILLIHGWISNKFRFVPEMTDAYLKRYDANVITVDWSTLAKQHYPTSVCYVPKVAEVVADFLCVLKEEFEMPMSAVHLVGHSLGGQMSGFIGQKVKRKCGEEVGRITAMDPAGPLYQGLPVAQRVDESDAAFVDVIHTNAAVLGYWGNCGDADFYVNCGTIQLGCPEITFTLESIKNIPVSVVTCHHSRSVDYMTESISTPRNFQAKGCSTCPLPCAHNILLKSAEKDIFMGEDCPDFANGGYVLTTNLYSPFGGDLRIIPDLPSLPRLTNFL